MTLDSNLVATLLMGVIGLIAAAGAIGTVLAFWSMGRQAYKD